MKFCFLLFTFIASSTLWAIDCESKKVIREYKPRYAQFFSIRYYPDFKIVDTGKNTGVDRFIVAEKKLDCTTKLFVFKSNTSRLVATSTTHLPVLSFFNLEDTLIAFQGLRYIYSPKFKREKIRDIHYQLHSEELLSLRPDLVMAYPANLAGTQRVEELRKLKIPVVLNYDFEEKHPLARAEWIIFSSTFFGKDQLAIEFFSKIERSYNEFKRQAQTIKAKNILVGDIQNGKWVTCGGASDLAILINDAGGNLILTSASQATQSLSLEKVFKLKDTPDIWLSQNNWKDLSLVNKDSRYHKFARVPVFNNNQLLNASGFNDYWETGLSRPDLLLKDLYGIFHPESMPNFHPVWYKELK